jgi:tetratricopeptide (TPR) repeat protein
MSESEKSGREVAYRKLFDAWNAGEHAYALELSREFLRDFPESNIALVIQGVILYELARYEEAEQVLRAAVLDAAPESLPHAYLHLGHLFRERGDYESAAKWYRQAAELEPDHAGRHIFLGEVLARKGDFSGAEKAHREATKCTKGDVDEAYLNLGLVLRAQERYEEALNCFEKALKLTPDYPEALKARADIRKALAYLQTIG